MKETIVRVWEETVTIPTYGIGQPEKNPMFLEKRVYQGSSGVVYPHPVVEKISDEKLDKLYKGLFLENDYLKIMILPELGGRVQMAYDKVKGRHFVYYNQVIKPALVGLTGPWISGGIEFNWPQHHRPSTFEPVDYQLQTHADGSATIRINEVERMFRMKGTAGFTLYRDKAYLEIKGKLYNRTPLTQTFLWWANPAVKVNDDYQSIFPPDVFAVFDHGKRGVSSFPIATGEYYKVNYAPGTDISWYKNIPVPTSYMAIASAYDFIGGYEHDTRAGVLHVADHHISPGKKQWTWGNGDFGKAWDRNLTDEDGPYIEIMTGVFTDNQPDFSFLQPYATKEFTQYFMPYQEVGMVKNATKEAILGVEIRAEQGGPEAGVGQKAPKVEAGQKAPKVEAGQTGPGAGEGSVTVKLYVTADYPLVNIRVMTKGGELLKEWSTGVSPATPFAGGFSEAHGFRESDLRIDVIDGATNKLLVAYAPSAAVRQELPAAAIAALPPEEVSNNEQLFLSGQHLEQYRHATLDPTTYYREALKRDKGDLRCNNALGLWYLRRGSFARSEQYFREAVRTMTQRNPNPYDGEPYYYLGMSLVYQGKADEAYEAFFKASWSDAWQHASWLELARIAAAKQDNMNALSFVRQSIIRNAHSHTALHLQCYLLRKMGLTEEARITATETLRLDPFNFGSWYELYCLDDKEAKQSLLRISRNWVHNFLEYAFDYAAAGAFREAKGLLELHIQSGEPVYPIVYYCLACWSDKLGDRRGSAEMLVKAASCIPDYCFPNRLEEITVLQWATTVNPGDAKAWYYLGNCWYDKRQYTDAIRCWEQAKKANALFATPWRNLAIAYFNKQREPEKARHSLETAFACDQSDARVLMELDQLYQRLNYTPAQRLALLESWPELVEQRDDLYLQHLTLLNLLGSYTEARHRLLKRRFHPWEGGEGKVVGQFLLSHMELAKQKLRAGEAEAALEWLAVMDVYPGSLGEGKLATSPENQLDYLKGLAYEAIDPKRARLFFEKATVGDVQPQQALFYNDAQPDTIFYQGLAWLKLGQPEKGQALFNSLVEFGKAHLEQSVRIDYFAVSLPDMMVFDVDLSLLNRIHCLYLMGLGHLGLQHTKDAEDCFAAVLQLQANHQGAVIHRQSVYTAGETEAPAGKS